jgi:hypothetical protein
MNFKQFFESRKSGAHHLSPTAIHSGGLHKTSGSMKLVADVHQKKYRKNQKIKRAKENKGTMVPISSTAQLNSIINKNSNGKKINPKNINAKGKTLNGKTGVKIKKNKFGKLFLQK